ncbi:hypothetical protein, partial [Porphyromonas endodontalis]|uniref:hypothetical protein n=1 Tax=Porphyromonas endodontalis TaxID=28124 RepID=UPI003FA00D2C
MMFNDLFCLTEEVIEERKLQTRRIEKGLELLSESNHKFDGEKIVLDFEASDEPIIIRPRYKVGESVAVAQSYNSAGISPTHKIYNDKKGQYENACDTAGWTNKMFVQPELMPHKIKITKVRLERLQDISEEDCIKEGIIKFVDRFDGYFGFYENKRGKFPHLFESESSAFACLIDRVSGKGTWAS